MAEKTFGIIRRAYYLLVAVIAIPMTIAGTIGVIQYNGDSDVMGLMVAGILIFPLSIIAHKAVHWVIWGKIN